MRRKTILTLLLAVALAAGGAQAKSVKVRVKKPGTLSQLIKPKDKYQITELTLLGALNSDDLRFLREMCGRDARRQPTAGRVRSVNLHGATFAPGGEPFVYIGPGPYSTSGPYTVPARLFFECPVEEVVLPARTDTIDHWALAHTRLRRLDLPEHAVIIDNIVRNDSLLTELTLPHLRETGDDFVLSRLVEGLKSLRKLTFRDVDYVSGGSFCLMPSLEELTFSGMVGHIDGYCVTGNPRLRTIRFSGTVMSTGGPQFVKDCPELESVTFDGTVFNTGYGEAAGCPKFRGYVVNGRVVGSDVPEAIPPTPKESYGAAATWTKPLAEVAGWMERYVENESFFGNIMTMLAPSMAEVAQSVGEADAAARFEALQAKRAAWKKEHAAALEADFGKLGDSHLETLRLTAPYVRTGQAEPAFRYAPPTDSLLRRTREYFNLDSIAGEGDDISRIKNLLYWVHDHVRHDGGSSWPQCRRNAVDLYELCQRENRPLNCRFMGIMLCEMLLAEGIPARYIVCSPQRWDTDPDCHIICVAWSTSLKKWIWVDPTFAAYVADENGLLLHPGEVRERLQKGLPLVLNEDANWNHEVKQTAGHYLEEYMAKNLYAITANSFNQSEPEGEAGHGQGSFVGLVPQGFKFGQARILTSDDEYFWQAPQETPAAGQGQ